MEKSAIRKRFLVRRADRKTSIDTMNSTRASHTKNEFAIGALLSVS